MGGDGYSVIVEKLSIPCAEGTVGLFGSTVAVFLGRAWFDDRNGTARPGEQGKGLGRLGVGLCPSGQDGVWVSCSAPVGASELRLPHPTRLSRPNPAGAIGWWPVADRRICHRHENTVRLYGVLVNCINRKYFMPRMGLIYWL